MAKHLVNAEYLRTDEREDLITSLKLVKLGTEQCQTDPQYWKWVLIGTQSSLQAAIVFHLSFGNDFLVAKPRQVNRWMAAYREGGDYPDMHMDYFMDLYDRAKSQDVMGHRLVATTSQDQSVKQLLDLRNDFVHFIPKGWSIELAGLPRICIDSLELISALGDRSLRTRWEDNRQAERFHRLVEDCLSFQRELDANYSAA